MYKDVIVMAKEGLHGQEQHALRTKQIEEAMRLQTPQLKLLYQLGIAQMIESEAKREIPPLVFEDDSMQPPKVDLRRTSDMIMLTILQENGLLEEGWGLDPTPKHTDTYSNLFNTTLRITAFRVADQKLEKFKNTHNVQSVFIDFTQDRHLKVVGDKTTFDGDLVTINDERLAQVQAGIKEAFSNPRIDPSSAWYLE